ncbi:efflux RND transporter periplasmic adaptor subunit [Thermaerobacillus caldiproteolyticus]|uniref:efflux RND transporter periplasmic adaptor subunit n=1 Tax=Thermaerobacillus caldiproteolyticus TaxID=247480 RepID=UPI0018F239EC|nr:HlyD family efflux transporter periplasmic adaptor subunit [Anoxybacillus caldiproteolyticus]
MYKKWILYSVIAICIALISINTYLLYTKEEPSHRTMITRSIVPVKKSNFQLFFPTKGVVTAPYIEKVFIPSDLETIDKILVRSGQEVQAGTPLLVQKSNQINEQIEQLEHEMTYLQQQLEDIEQSIQHVETDNQMAEQQEGINTMILQQLQSEKRAIETKINNVSNQKVYLEKQKEKQLIKSPITGIVEKVELKEQHPFISIISPPYLIESTLSEMDLTKIKKGQQVKISPFGQHDHRYMGNVVEIGKIPIHAPSLSNKESRYPFYVRIENDEQSLPYGSHVSLSVILKESKNALSIPKKSIVQKEKKPIVYTISKGKVKKCEVEIGLSNGLQQEVITGLHDHDWVISNPPSSIKENMLVAKPLELKKIQRADLRYLSKKEILSLIIAGFFRTNVQPTVEKIAEK